MHKLIVADAKQAKRRGLPVLSLVARVAHGEILQKVYQAAGLNFVFLKGEDDMVERRKQLLRLTDGTIDGIIGTTIMDVGVDVPVIGLLQLCGGMKAKVSLLQRIGRCLRRKKLVANIAFVADYSCNYNTSLRDHARTREGIIRSTPGFVEGLLEPGTDFPWHNFPIIQKAA
jgi:superfamily II DNA or RNA helicase